MPGVDIHPTLQHPWPATKMKFHITHLHKGTFFGSHGRRYASPEAHPSQVGLCTDILNGAQGYRTGVDERPCRTLRPTQKRQISLLNMTAALKFYHMEGSAIDCSIRVPFFAVNRRLGLIVAWMAIRNGHDATSRSGLCRFALMTSAVDDTAPQAEFTVDMLGAIG
jgi:hypothetical protein